MAKGTEDDPITTTTDDPRGYKFCKCGVCGLVAQCTPSQDFYAVPGSVRLRCEPCVTRPMKDENRKRRIERN